MDDRSPADSPTPCRVPIHHLTDHQVELLRTVLRAGEVPFGIVRGEVVAPGEFAEEIEKAVTWAAVDTTVQGDNFDDPEYRSSKPPIVKPPRPPLRDGRRQATRWRRLAGGVLDEVLVGLPTLTAHQAGAPLWTGAVIHAVYYIVPTAMFGWSIGKLCLGTRVVDIRTQRTPGITAATIRWLVAALPMLLGMFFGLKGDWMSVAVLSVYAPIVADLRGLHDYAAGTLVANRTASGPGSRVLALRRDRLPG